MNGAVLGANVSLSAEWIDQTVVPDDGLPSASVQLKAVPPQACTSMPRCRWYQACRAFGSLAEKKMPPMPVTRFMRSSQLEKYAEPERTPVLSGVRCRSMLRACAGRL